MDRFSKHNGLVKSGAGCFAEAAQAEVFCHLPQNLFVVHANADVWKSKPCQLSDRDIVVRAFLTQACAEGHGHSGRRADGPEDLPTVLDGPWEAEVDR